MSQTPTLAQTILDTIEGRLTGLHTMLPGIVVAVDVAKGTCDVKPTLKRLRADGTASDLPVIVNCPIAFYRAGAAAVYLPLAVGHSVEIRFCERSLDIWLTKGGTVDPKDARKHNLSDAVVYPGLYDFTQAPSGADPANLVIVNGSSKITMTPDGKFKIGATEELFAILSDLIAKLKTVQVPTMLGPQGFLPTDVAALDAIKTRLDGLKG